MKSTLAKHISEQFQVPYCHTGPPPPNTYEFDSSRAVLAGHNFRNDLIVDRAIISNLVYYPIMRRGIENTPAHFSRFMDFLYNTQSLVIFTQAADSTLIQRYLWRGDEHPEINVQSLPLIAAAYRKVMIKVMGASVKTLTYQSDEQAPEVWVDRHTADLVRAINPLRGGIL